MSSILSFAKRYAEGICTLPYSFTFSAAITVTGHALGVLDTNVIQRFFQKFQTIPSPRLDASLSASPLPQLPSRFVVAISYNQLEPIFEEASFRFVLQDKILTKILPDAKHRIWERIVPSKFKEYTESFPLNANQVTRIAITSLVFSLPHYIQALEVSDPSLSAEVMHQDALFNVLNSFGISLVYGYAYEKGGLASAWGAHAVWNAFHDLWFLLPQN